MKPIIGVIPLWDDSKNSIWMIPGYLDMIRLEGGIPIIFPLKGDNHDIIQLCDMCDGFLLTGGHDINPTLYGEVPTAKCGTVNPERDSLEKIVFTYAIDNNRPLLGICRGIQIINAFCGGTLYQDLPSERNLANSVNHQMTPPYDKPCHKVSIIPNTPLYDIIEISEIEVNSYHHQAIKRISTDLKAMALSEDGLVEAVYMPNCKFIQAFQWHPELNFHCDENSRKIVKAFIDATK